jgi:hypothetical protein
MVDTNSGWVAPDLDDQRQEPEPVGSTLAVEGRSLVVLRRIEPQEDP